MYHTDEQMTKFQKNCEKKTGEIMLTDSYTNVSSFSSNKSYNLRIFKSEKIGVDGDVKLLKAIALTTFFCRRYTVLVWYCMYFIRK